MGPLAEAVKEPAKKPLPAQQPAGRGSGQETPYTISRKTVKTAALVAACGLMLFGGFSLFGGGEEVPGPAGPAPVDQGYQNETEETASLADPEEQQPTYDPAVIAALDAHYYIDYENGTIPIGDLPIGDRVVDPSWEWEYRTGDNYSGSGAVKPVTWVVVAKDHYDGLQPHVTLLAEELIGKHAFDDSTNRGHQYAEYGYNHWGDSGTANATHGLRPWLNSTGIHSSEGFYRAFSERFKSAVLNTTVPNKEWENGTAYSTKDYVFISTTTELGDTDHNWTYPIGSAYPYFTGAGDAIRVARLNGETWYYWTRSPASDYGGGVRYINSGGEFRYCPASHSNTGVRPALNLKSGILVSEIKN